MNRFSFSLSMLLRGQGVDHREALLAVLLTFFGERSSGISMALFAAMMGAAEPGKRISPSDLAGLVQRLRTMHALTALSASTTNTDLIVSPDLLKELGSPLLVIDPRIKANDQLMERLKRLLIDVWLLRKTIVSNLTNAFVRDSYSSDPEVKAKAIELARETYRFLETANIKAFETFSASIQSMSRDALAQVVGGVVGGPNVSVAALNNNITATTATTATDCCVCMSEPGSITLCDGCKSPVCSDCATHYIGAEATVRAINGAPIPCFGCRAVVPFSVWSNLPGMHGTASWFRDTVLGFSFRCPYCHNDTPVIASAPPFDATLELGIFSDEVADLLSALSRGHMSSLDTRMVKTLVNAFVEIDVESNRGSGHPDEHNWVWQKTSVLWGAIHLIAQTSPDCAATLALRILRVSPAFQTACCDAPMCWTCQRQDQHLGKSCAEVDGANDFDDLMECPGCGVMLLKTEGCNSVTCTMPMCLTSFCWKCGNIDCSCDPYDDYY